MSQAITNQQASQPYQILVKSMATGNGEIFSYEATDTIKALHEKIKEREGIPVEQQRLYATYDRTKCWQTQEIDDADALLTVQLQHVKYLTVGLKLRQN